MRRLVLVLLLILLLGLAGGYLFVRASLGSDLVRRAVERQLAAAVGQPARIGSVGTSVFPRITLDLQHVSIGEPAAIHLTSVRLATGLRGLLSRLVRDAEVVVTGGRVTLPLPFPLVAATRQDAGESAAPSITIASVRAISMRDIELTGGSHTVRLDLESSLEGDRLDVRDLSARAGQSHVRATGVVESVAELKARFKAKADRLDLDELMAIGAALTGPPQASDRRGAAMPMNLIVGLAAPQGKFSGYEFRDLTGSLQATASQIILSDLALKAFRGSFAGRLDVDTRGAAPQLRLSGRIDGLDAAELLEASGSPGGLTGRLGGTVVLSAAGSATQGLLSTARGTITAAITDGTLPHLEMVRAIVLAFGKPSGAPPEGSGSAFSRLGGSFSLADGVLSSPDLAMASRDFDLQGSGSLAIATGALDARADVMLSHELTAQAGTDLRRYAQEDGRVIVPARITGTLQQPVISLDIAAATRRALGNELKRRATSFIEGLFKKRKN